MVKKIWSFICWQFSRFKWDDYVLIVAALMLGYGWDDKSIFFFLGSIIILAMMIGALVKIQWMRWKIERQELLETIRDSK